MTINGQTFANGAINSPYDIRDYKLSSTIKKECLPDSFELDMCDVKNQGTVSSCVAHALSEVIEYHYKKETKSYVRFSTGYIYGNRQSYTGKGMVMRDAIKTVASCGDVRNSLFDSNIEVPKAIDKFNGVKNELERNAYPYRFSSYYRVYTEEEIKTALIKHGPVVFSINWYNDISVNPISGIISTKCNEKDADGRHCMVIYGWTKDGWKIQNSWSEIWGIAGRAVLPFNVPLNEAWGIVDNILEKDEGADSDIVKPFTSSIGKVFAKSINIVVRGARIVWGTVIGLCKK